MTTVRDVMHSGLITCTPNTMLALRGLVNGIAMPPLSPWATTRFADWKPTGFQPAYLKAVADVATVSGGRFGPEPMSIYQEWDAFIDFASTLKAATMVSWLADSTDVRIDCPSARLAKPTFHR